MSFLDVLKSPALRVPKPSVPTLDIVDVPDPDQVIIPLEYPGQIFFRPLVQVGDEVACNQVIGASERGNYIHASISGKVVELKPVWSARSFHVPAVVIEKGSAPALSGDELLRQCGIDAQSATRLDLLRAAGVISPWTTPGRDDSESEIEGYPEIVRIIVKGVNQEPTNNSFRLLLRARFEHVKTALKRVAEIIPQAKIQLTVAESETRWAAKTFADLADVVGLKNDYRDRIEQQVVRRLTGLHVTSNVSYRELGVAVVSVEQLLDMYDALEGRTCTRKVVTISTSDAAEPVTVRAAVGSTIGHLLASQGVVVQDGDRLIVGGPMTGIAQYTLDTPLSKFQAGVHVQRAADIVVDVNLTCINCGRCVQACPENMQVHLIGRCVEFNQLADAQIYRPGACTKCGLCAYVCPAHRPLLQMVAMAGQYGE